MSAENSLDDPSHPPRDLRRLVVGSVGTRLVNVALGAIAGIVIARELAPLGRGQYAVVITAANTAIALGHLSVEQAHVAMWRNNNRRRALIANAAVLAILIGTLAAFAAYGLVQLLGDQRLPVYSDRGMAIALAAVPTALLALYTNSLAALSARVPSLNRGILLSAVGQTASLLTLAALHRLTVTAVVVVWAISTTIPLLATLPVLRPRLRDVSVPLMRTEIARGLQYHAGAALLFLLLRADVFLVNAFRSQEEVGLYALAVTLAELVYLLSDSVAQVIVSRQASGDHKDSVQITTLAVRLTVTGAGIAIIGLGLSGPVIVPAVYGNAFNGSVAPFVVLLPGVLAFAVGRPIASLLTAWDRPRIVVALSGGAFALNAALAIALIPNIGVVGAALSSSIAYALLCLGYLLAAVRLTGCDWSDFVPDLTEARRLLVQR